MKRYIFSDIAALLFIILFAYTATSKFLDHELFVFQLRLAPLPFMIPLAPLLGWLMPGIEAIIVILLSIKKYRLKGLYASVILMFLFEIYILAMLSTGSHLPCTCGGIISTMTWKQHLPFNAFFILIGIAGIIKSNQQKKDSRQFAESL